MLRRASLERSGSFDASRRRGQDFDLWVRLANDGARIGYQERVLHRYRLRSDSLSGSPSSYAERELNAFRAIRKKLSLQRIGPLAYRDASSGGGSASP